MYCSLWMMRVYVCSTWLDTVHNDAAMYEHIYVRLYILHTHTYAHTSAHYVICIQVCIRVDTPIYTDTYLSMHYVMCAYVCAYACLCIMCKRTFMCLHIMSHEISWWCYTFGHHMRYLALSYALYHIECEHMCTCYLMLSSCIWHSTRQITMCKVWHMCDPYLYTYIYCYSDHTYIDSLRMKTQT